MRPAANGQRSVVVNWSIAGQLIGQFPAAVVVVNWPPFRGPLTACRPHRAIHRRHAVHTTATRRPSIRMPPPRLQASGVSPFPTTPLPRCDRSNRAPSKSSYPPGCHHSPSIKTPPSDRYQEARRDRSPRLQDRESEPLGPVVRSHGYNPKNDPPRN